MKYLNIENDNSFVRDKNTMAIVNIDNEEFEKHLMKKKHTINNMNKIKNIDEEITHMKSDITEIKSLLYKMLENR